MRKVKDFLIVVGSNFDFGRNKDIFLNVEVKCEVDFVEFEVYELFENIKLLFSILCDFVVRRLLKEIINGVVVIIYVEEDRDIVKYWV